MYIQSLEVRGREVFLELLPKVKEGVETVGDQDVLKRKGNEQKDVSKYLISSCHFITLITLLFAYAARAHTSFFIALGCVINHLDMRECHQLLCWCTGMIYPSACVNGLVCIKSLSSADQLSLQYLIQLKAKC